MDDQSAPPRLGVAGDNAPSPFDQVRLELEDLRLEAGNWLNGDEVKSQAEADALGKMLERVRACANRADAERIKEKAPHDAAVTEIQARYNALIGKTTKLTGLAPLIEDAAKTALSGWLRKVAAEQEARRLEALRIASEEAAKAELHIAHTHDTTDIDDREAANAQADVARRAAFDLAQANKAKPQAAGDTRAIGLRTVYTPEITDMTAALKHYWGDRPDAFRPLVEQFAKDDIRAGKRSGIPGITVNEERRV